MATNHFTGNIKTLRTSRGYSQADMAKLLGCNCTSTYGAYEEGRATPSFDRLILIAGIFRVTIDDLLKNEIVIKIDTRKIHLNQ